MCSCPSPVHNCFIYHRKIQGGLLSSVRTVSLGGLLCNPGGRSPNDTTSLCWDRISDRVEGAEQKQRAPEGIRPDLKATAKRLAPATGPISCRSKLCAGFVQPLALQTPSMNSSFFPSAATEPEELLTKWGCTFQTTVGPGLSITLCLLWKEFGLLPDS